VTESLRAGKEKAKLSGLPFIGGESVSDGCTVGRESLLFLQAVVADAMVRPKTLCSKRKPTVTRSVVDGIVGKCKTETSRRPVPIDELTIAELLAWEAGNLLRRAGGLGVRQRTSSGQKPPWADTLLDRFLQRAAKRTGITKWAGFHGFRHTYSTLLKANGEDVKVVQELMRHANISTTVNIYTKASASAKREAQSRVVDVLLDRSRNVVESAAEDAA
jgi:integrase